MGKKIINFISQVDVHGIYYTRNKVTKFGDLFSV